MTPAPGPSRRGESGFVLIGVVIFVLALTIIGMSLYSLSGYEAQFLQRSQDGEQAFQSAVGGLERVKYVLSASPYTMDRVKQNFPSDLVAASAIQVQGGLPDSTSPVEWGGADVYLSVTAQVGQEQRTIRGFFRPRLTRQVYTQLVATSGGIVVEPEDPPGVNRLYTVHLSGPIWEGIVPPDTLAWQNVVGADVPRGIATDPVAVPQVAQFFSDHSGAPSLDPGPFNDGSVDWLCYKLFAPGSVGFFTTPLSMVSDPDFSLHDNQTTNDILLGVKGCAVWLMPRGIRFDRKVKVIGWDANPACLIIVADKSLSTTYGDPDAGIWFDNGLQSTIPVILVSNGRVRIQHLNPIAPVDNSFAPELTVYARDLVLTGPDVASTMQMWLAHTPGGALDTYWVPLPANAGYLPNLSSTSGRELALLPGTWRVTGR